MSDSKVNKQPMNQRGWLFDGSLRGISLQRANLFEEYFSNANLSGINFTEAILQGSDWLGASAKGAIFNRAEMANIRMDTIDAEGATFDYADITGGFITGNLRYASFRYAKLQESILSGDWRNTILEEANLTGAKLVDMDLRGANLNKATLQNVFLKKIISDETTILPDGSRGPLTET
jgi:hypothetical protein